MERRDIWAIQDECLIAMEDGRDIPMPTLRKLPPWRAVLIARVGLRCGAITQEEVDRLVNDAIEVGGNGTLPAK